MWIIGESVDIRKVYEFSKVSRPLSKLYVTRTGNPMPVGSSCQSQVLGKGQFGTTRLAKHRETGQPVSAWGGAQGRGGGGWAKQYGEESSGHCVPGPHGCMDSWPQAHKFMGKAGCSRLDFPSADITHQPMHRLLANQFPNASLQQRKTLRMFNGVYPAPVCATAEQSFTLRDQRAYCPHFFLPPLTALPFALRRYSGRCRYCTI